MPSKKNSRNRNRQVTPIPTSTNKTIGSTIALGNPGLKNWATYLAFIAFTSACVLVFYPPFFKGLFMNPPLYITYVFTGFILIIVTISSYQEKNFSLLKTSLDWAVLAFALAYLLSLIGAVHPGDALFGLIKVLNYIAVYWIVSLVVRNSDQMETVVRVLIASGAGVAAIGLLASLGLSAYPHAFDGRTIVSTLQYSNTTAAFLSAIVILTIGLWSREKKSFLQLIYLTVGSFSTLVILASLSKGAWLAFILGIIVLLAGGRGFRSKIVYGLLVILSAATATFVNFYPAITGEGTHAPRWLLVCFFVSVFGTALWGLKEYLIRSKAHKILAAMVAIILLLVSIPVVIRVSDQLNNSNLVVEVSEVFDITNSSYYGRIAFYKWALEIIKDHPINGTGAGGWSALYRQYQDSNASTEDVHNHHLNIWIEAGTIGFIAWMLILASFIWCLKKTRTKVAEREWLLILAIGSALIVLLAHAAIDFDLTIPAMSIFLWAMLGLINNGYTRSAVTQSHPISMVKFVNGTLAAMVSLILLISGMLAYSAYLHAARGTELIRLSSERPENQQAYLQQARQEMHKAIRLNPFNGEYQAVWSTVNALIYSSADDPNSSTAVQSYNDALIGIEDSEKLQPYNVNNRQRLLESAILLANGELILQQAEGLLNSKPNDINLYIILADVLWEAFQYSLSVNDDELARNYATQLVGLEDRLRLQVQKINPNLPWYGDPLEFPAQTKEKILIAREYTKKY